MQQILFFDIEFHSIQVSVIKYMFHVQKLNSFQLAGSWKTPTPRLIGNILIWGKQTFCPQDFQEGKFHCKFNDFYFSVRFTLLGRTKTNFFCSFEIYWIWELCDWPLVFKSFFELKFDSFNFESNASVLLTINWTDELNQQKSFCRQIFPRIITSNLLWWRKEIVW
jgi:hypothetical protein